MPNRTRQVEFSINFVGNVLVDNDKKIGQMSDKDFEDILQLTFLTTFGPIIECLMKAENNNDSACVIDFADFEKTAIEVAKLTGTGTNENILRLAIKAVYDFSTIATSARLEDILENINGKLSKESSEKDSSEVG